MTRSTPLILGSVVVAAASALDQAGGAADADDLEGEPDVVVAQAAELALGVVLLQAAVLLVHSKPCAGDMLTISARAPAQRPTTVPPRVRKVRAAPAGEADGEGRSPVAAEAGGADRCLASWSATSAALSGRVSGEVRPAPITPIAPSPTRTASTAAPIQPAVTSRVRRSTRSTMPGRVAKAGSRRTLRDG